jgi:putative sigma-54 modulation protein
MNTKIQAVGFNADQKLMTFVETKTKKLLTFYDKIVDTDVNLKLDSHTKVKDKIALVRCNIPNATVIAEHTAKSFEEAVDEAIDDIRRQLKKKKEQYMANRSDSNNDLFQFNEVADDEWED